MVRTFQARTGAEALRSVRGELGEDAVILESRTLSSGMVEVRASRGHLRLVPAPRPLERPPMPDLRAELEPVRALLRGFLREADAARRHGIPPVAAATFLALVDAGVPEASARSLAQDAAREASDADEAAVRRAARHLLAQRCACAGPIVPEAGGRKVIALFGPTGVGKTTTVSKIAASFALRGGHKVGLVAADAQRLGAIEQVRRYAEILGAPFAVALTRDGLREALASMREASLVLIDTAGRSARASAEVDALAAIFERPPCRIERHLCLAANAKERDNLAAAERFRAVGYQRLLFTKLDETETFGGLYAVARAARRPLSYLSTGPRIPDDLEPAAPERVAGLILPHQGDADESAP
jgi:flagellar biosynthesis protein FlhF